MNACACSNIKVLHNILIPITNLQVSEAVKFGAELLESNTLTLNGVYEINDVCGGKVHTFHDNILTQQAHCSTKDNDGGWTVILRRKTYASQPVNFTRSWDDYVQGFGNLNTEFWYGLRNIHCLTTREQVELQLLVTLTNGTSLLWTYHQFVVDPPEDKYTLHVGEAEVPSGEYDILSYSNDGRPFTTYDSDNDNWSLNCALYHLQGNGGGWWYSGCSHIFLTHPRPSIHYPDRDYLDFVEMKVRPKRCTS